MSDGPADTADDTADDAVDAGAAGAMIWCPFPDEEQAAHVARIVVEERLVACANLIGPVRSIFRWQHALDEARECGAVFKTTAAFLDKAVERIGELHPYDTPAVMGWRIDAAPDTALLWLTASTSAKAAE